MNRPARPFQFELWMLMGAVPAFALVFWVVRLLGFDVGIFLCLAAIGAIVARLIRRIIGFTFGS